MKRSKAQSAGRTQATNAPETSPGGATHSDPTTAGDFCRRFKVEDVERLMGALNEARLEVWREQPAEFFEEAFEEEAAPRPSRFRPAASTPSRRAPWVWGVRVLE